MLVADGCMPKPFRIGKRVIWVRLELDAAFACWGNSRAGLTAERVDCRIRAQAHS